MHFIASIILMLRFYYLRAGLYTFMYSKDILFILKYKRFSSSKLISLVSPTFVENYCSILSHLSFICVENEGPMYIMFVGKN